MDVTRFSIQSYIGEGEAFHFARKNLDKRFPDAAHDHDYFEVFLIVKGETQHWINGEMQALGPGHMAFVRPGDAHAFRADRDRGCQIINVMFRVETAAHLVDRYREDLAERFFDWRGPLPESYVLHGPRFERAVNIAQSLQTARRSLSRIEGFLLSLTNRVVERKTHPNSSAPPWFSRACQAVREPEVFRRGSAGFVAVAGRSHEHVCRVTRAELGLTPSAFVNSVRIEHAAMLLGRGELAIPDVAATIGIENLSHFYRLFRQQYGLTPRQYRMRHQTAPF